MIGVGLVAAALLTANSFAIANSMLKQQAGAQKKIVAASSVANPKKAKTGLQALQTMQISAPKQGKVLMSSALPTGDKGAPTQLRDFQIDPHAQIIADLNIPPAGAKYLSIPAAGFTPNLMIEDQPYDFFRPSGALSSRTSVNWFSAPVYLPEGAVPFELQMRYHDKSPEKISLALHASGKDVLFQWQQAPLESVNQPQREEGYRTVKIETFNIQVDPAKMALYLTVFFNGTDEENIKLIDARIGYVMADGF